MDDKTNGAIPSAPKQKKRLSITETLGAMMYYDEKADLRGKSFESLPKVESEPYIGRAGRILLAIDKMDYMLVPKVTQEELEARRRSRIDNLTRVIAEFVKGLKTTKPELFPYGELAHVILAGEEKK